MSSDTSVTSFTQQLAARSSASIPIDVMPAIAPTSASASASSSVSSAKDNEDNYVWDVYHMVLNEDEANDLEQEQEIQQQQQNKDERSHTDKAYAGQSHSTARYTTS